MISPEFRSMSHVKNPLNIREDNRIPLILFKRSQMGLELSYANTPLEKDNLIDNYNEASDFLLMPWPGKKRTDVFALSSADLQKHYSSNP